MSREIVHRVRVDVEPDEGTLEHALASHLELRPSGFGGRVDPFGFTFRREPAVFHIVATGTSLGSAILLAEFSTRVRSLATATQVLSGAFFCAAIYLLTSFVRNAKSRLEVLAEGDAVTIRQRGLFRTRETKLPADDIVGVIVAKDEDGGRSVVIAGPRHTALLDVHRAKLLDPDSLSVWIADGVGIVARKASARPARPCGRLHKQSLARQAGSAS